MLADRGSLAGWKKQGQLSLCPRQSALPRHREYAL